MRILLGTGGAAAVVCLVLCGGCREQESPRVVAGPPAAPRAAAPASVPPGASAVKAERSVADEEVRKHWRAVELQVQEKTQGGPPKSVQVAIGGETRVPGSPLLIRVLAFVPDFAMDMERVASKSMNDVNPAAKLQVLEDGTMKWTGWAFRDFPDMHSFEDPRYTIKMSRAIPVGR